MTINKLKSKRARQLSLAWPCLFLPRPHLYSAHFLHLQLTSTATSAKKFKSPFHPIFILGAISRYPLLLLGHSYLVSCGVSATIGGAVPSSLVRRISFSLFSQANLSLISWLVNVCLYKFRLNKNN